MRDAREDRRVGDLVAVQMQDRQHRAVGRRVQEFVAVPRGRERPGFGLAVADHAGRDQVGIVEDRAIGMRQRIAEFTAFMNRTRRFGCSMARDAARKAELAEQPAHAVLRLRHARIKLAVGAFEPGVGDHAGAAMARAADIDDIEVARLDDPVEVGIDEIEPRRRAQMAEQPRFDVGAFERLFEKRVVEQVDLSDRQVIRRPPPPVDQFELDRDNGPAISVSSCAAIRSLPQSPANGRRPR